MTDHKILTIDIGGTHLKATVLNAVGEEVDSYNHIETPHPANPQNVLEAIRHITKDFSDYHFISVGFPGFVKAGVVKTAPNLGTELWQDINFAEMLSDSFSKPAKVVNDADLQGIGIASGIGFEVVITLGTGFGTALLQDGTLFPHIELAHHPIRHHKDYDQFIGDHALKKIGVDKWKKRIREVFDILKNVLHYDQLYISGGNARLIDFPIDGNMKIANNESGIRGGAKLWASHLETIN